LERRWCTGRHAEWDGEASVVSQTLTELLVFLDELLSYLESVRDHPWQGRQSCEKIAGDRAVDPEDAGPARRGVGGAPETLTRSGPGPKIKLIRYPCGSVLVRVGAFG
jgi:hypothetical protein